MKKLLIIFFLLVNNICFSQADNSPGILSFAKEVIGHPLAHLKDSVKCAEASGITSIYIRPAEPGKCRTFYYLPKDRSITITAGVGFGVLLLDTDSLRRVSSVSCIRLYESKGSWPQEGEFEADYKLIEGSFTNLFQAEGIKAPDYKDDYSTKSSSKWVNGSFDIILEKTIFSRNGNINKALVISLFIVPGSN